MSNDKKINQKGTPIANKGSKPQNIESAAGFTDGPFELDAKLVAELEEQGLVAHFCNVRTIEQHGGYHPKGWRPYKRKSEDNANTFTFGRDPDGLTRRGDVILGVKTKEEGLAHRQILDREATRAKIVKGADDKKRELIEHIKKAGMSDYLTVKEGYDD